MKGKQKILVILTPGFPASESDTTCLPMHQDLVRAVQRLDPSLQIFVLSFQYPYHKKIYSLFNATIISYGGRNKGGMPRLFLRTQIKATLNELRAKHEIIGLFSFWCGECALVGKRFGDRHNIPHYCWVLGQDARENNPYPGRLDFQPEELIALSDFLQSEFEKNHHIRPLTVIPPGVDHSRMVGGNMAQDIDLLAVGSLIPLKQYSIFLKIVAALRKDFPGLKAVLAGDGPEREDLKQQIGLYGLEKNVSLAGELPYNDVLRLMQRAKIFLHPSSYEGFSGVCLEALSAGAQVISFCQPMNYQIKNWQIARSPGQMTTMAKELLQEPLMGFEAEQGFTIEKTAKEILNLFI
jgi:glycosyltransferase involved in cell wall biosynthesis